jgi:cell wall-associated NlpC family hydrolase
MASNGNSSSGGIIAIAVGLVLVVILFVVGLSGGGNDNAAQGATAPQPINLTNPADLQSISLIKQLANPQASITSLKASALPKIITEVDNLKANVDKWTIPNDQKASVKLILSNIENQIYIINSTSVTNTSVLEKARNTIYSDVLKIQTIITNSNPNSNANAVINQAVKLANLNIASNYTLYPYYVGGELNQNLQLSSFGNGKKGVDCSGFITYLLKFGGIMPQGASRLSTANLSTWSNYTKTVNIPAANSAKPTYTELFSALSSNPPTLQPGDLIVNSGVHVVMYIGSKFNSNGNDVVESGGSGARSGIKYTTLKGIMSSSNWASSSSIVILRPNYKSL